MEWIEAQRQRVDVTVLWVWCAGVALVLLLSGCGGQRRSTHHAISRPRLTSSTSSSSFSSQSFSQSSTETSSASSSLSTSLTATVPGEDGGSMTLTVTVSLGAPSQDTSGDNPGYTNVTVPVTGSASLDNSSSYSLTPNLLQVDALYPSATSVCKHQGPDAEVDGNQENAVDAVVPFYRTGGASLCRVLVASLYSPCNAGDNGQGLGSVDADSTATLQVVPNGSSVDASCGGEPSAGNLIFNAVPNSSVNDLSSQLTETPAFWVVMQQDGTCTPAANASPDATTAWTPVASEPSGLRGCF